jgi:hypothetical protein
MALLGASAFTVATRAHADDKATCTAAYTAGQEQRNASQFTLARETLAICARPTCKDWMVAECVRWLEDVDRRQPTVTLAAEGARGELVDIVKVDLDGKPFAKELDGRAVALDPGKHTLTFVARDGSTVSVSKMIAEGQKVVAIKATFEIKPAPPAPPAPAPPAPAPPVVLQPANATPASTSAAPEAKSNPWRTTGFITGGAGVAGLGVGAAFGLIALNKKGSSHCDASNVCDAGSAGGIRDAALISDVGWVAGSVLLAGGAAILLFGPGKSAARTGLNVTPMATPNGGALVIGGGFQ